MGAASRVVGLGEELLKLRLPEAVTVSAFHGVCNMLRVVWYVDGKLHDHSKLVAVWVG